MGIKNSSFPQSLLRSALPVHGALLFVTASWGINNIVMKIGFREIMAEQFAGMRMLAALPFMLYLAFFKPGRIPFDKRDMLKIIVISSLGMALFQILFPLGVDQTSAPLGGILMATMPVHVVIISLMFRLERPRLISIAGVLLTVLGLGIIMAASGIGSGGSIGGIEAGNAADLGDETTLFGIAMIVISEFGYAINTTFLRPFMKKYPSLQVTGLALTVAVVLFLGVNGRYLVRLNFSEVSQQTWWAVLYSGLFPLFVCNVLWNLSVKHIGSTRVAVYGNLPPVFVLLFGAIILNQVLYSLQIVGAAVVLTGVVMVQMREKSEKAEIQDSQDDTGTG